MQWMVKITCLVCGLLAAALLLFLYLYLTGAYWPFLYGSWAHTASRFHPLMVHCSVGIVLGYLFLEAYICFTGGSEMAAAKKSFLYLSHFFLLLSLISGLVMELIERYPNEHINDHFLWAMGGYVFFTIMPFALQLPMPKNLAGKYRRQLACLFFVGFAAAVIVNVARLGALVYKGSGFFH